MLTQEQIDFYNENGYLGVEMCSRRRRLLIFNGLQMSLLRNPARSLNIPMCLTLNRAYPENPRVRRIKSPVLHHIVYEQTLRHDRILNIVEQLIGPGVSIMVTNST